MIYIYLLLLVLVIYYLFSNLFQKFSNQEDFDPTLIPTSSIITLAKVAQKLVYGSGTLTNPGNLTLGISGNLGNLTVTGTNTVNGESTFNNNVTVNGTSIFTGNNKITGSQTITGDHTISGNNNITGAITTSTGNLNVRTTDNNMTVGLAYTGPGIKSINKNLELGAGSNNVYVGPVNNSVKNNLIVTGNSQINELNNVSGNTNLNGNTNIIDQLTFSKGTASPDNTIIKYNGNFSFSNTNSQPLYLSEKGGIVFNNGGLYCNKNGRNIIADIYNLNKNPHFNT